MSRVPLPKIWRWLPALLLAALAAGCADNPYSPPPPASYYYPYSPYAYGYGWPGYDDTWDYGWYGAYGYGYGPYGCCGFGGYYGWPGGYYGWNGGHGPWPGGPGRPPPGGWHHYPGPHTPVPVGRPGGGSHSGAMHAPPAHFSHSHGH